MTIAELRRLRAYTQRTATPDGYPNAWPQIAAAIRRQAGYRCQRCGHPSPPSTKHIDGWSPCDEQCRHGGPVAGLSQLVYRQLPGQHGPALQRIGVRRAQWRILTVHHLDGDKLNCRWWNLTALCQRCHLHVQATVRLDHHWPHEHAEWIKPHIAGYYAHRLGLDPTRDEVISNLDDLLDLEHRQLQLGAAA